MAFPITPANLERWRGWFRHIARDQVLMWMGCCFIGLALPCMLSLVFLRNTPVSDHRVAAMVAEGMSDRFPGLARHGLAADPRRQLPHAAPSPCMPATSWRRHWTDILWATSPAVHRLRGHQVKHLYYGLLTVYAVWGSITLATYVAAPDREGRRGPGQRRAGVLSVATPCSLTARSCRGSSAQTRSCNSA